MNAALKAMRSTTEEISLSPEEEALLAHDEETRHALRLMVSASRSLAQQHIAVPDPDLELRRITATSASRVRTAKSAPRLRAYIISALTGAAAMLALVAGINHYGIRSSQRLSSSPLTQTIETPSRITIATSEGETLTLNMADGTSVTLNNNSRLSYPRHFEGDTRDVHLEGEALFRVSRDHRHPFVVHTKELITTVHGTTFDVKAYPSQPTSVALVEGSVEVKPTSNGKPRRITPGQRAILGGQGITVIPVSTDEEIAWSEGMVYYDNRRMEDIAADLSQRLQMPVVFRTPAVKELRLNFAIQKHQSAAEIIDLLNSLNSFKVTLEKGQIVIE